MHTSERHRNKRPFQSSITSYFPRDDDFDSDSDDSDNDSHLRRGQGLHSRPRTQHYNKSAAQPREALAPQLPGHVQADLLSVGMRVRKSVPEGYKTVNKMPALPSIQTTLLKPGASGLEVKPPRDAVPDDYVHQRELLPFCGLHKIGGFAEQPTTNLHLYGGLDPSGNRSTNLFPLPAEAFSQPFSSQDSGYGSDFSQPNPLNPSKRSWQDEDDMPLNANFFFANPFKAKVEADDVPVSPLSESPPPFFNTMPAVRQIAQPKSRRPVVARTGSEDSMDTDMSFEHPARADGRIDFEEADFLDGHEVAMGGV